MISNIIDALKNLNYTEIFGSLGIENITKFVFNSTKQFLEKENKSKKKDPQLNTLLVISNSEEEMFNQLKQSIQSTWYWCYTIQFQDLQEKKYLTDVFISLDFYLTPKKVHLTNMVENTSSIDDIIANEESNLIILGGPGAGKTTLSKYLSLVCFSKREILNNEFSFPLVIRLRELSTKELPESFYEIILSNVGMYIDVISTTINNNTVNVIELNSTYKKSHDYISLLKRTTINILDELNLLLILDGYDEIPDRSYANIVLKNVQELCLGLQKSKIIVTSRTGQFDVNIQNAQTLEICPLSDSQIKDFIFKWIKNDIKSMDLYCQIKESPFYDTAIRPINIAHLCALYLRYNQIPKQPKTVYSKIITLLIEDWDMQRGIIRESQYAEFTIQRKLEFLSSLAYTLTTKYNTSIFEASTLQLAYQDICLDFALPSEEVNIVVKGECNLNCVIHPACAAPAGAAHAG